MPQPPDNQYAGRRATSAAHAISSWLHYCEVSEAGAELDLSRAYDNIDHAVSTQACICSGAPAAGTFTAVAAWRGPRYCSVNSSLAPPIWATRGLPQGDS
eukprot:1515453-Pyramimonas_sp.AAC.1